MYLRAVSTQTAIWTASGTILYSLWKNHPCWTSARKAMGQYISERRISMKNLLDEKFDKIAEGAGICL